MRKITVKEFNLLSFLLSGVLDYDISKDFMVESLPDGGMGSFCINNSIKKYKERQGKKTLIEKVFKDSDGMLIVVSLILDQDGKLFEVDIWRADNNPVLLYPSTSSFQYSIDE